MTRPAISTVMAIAEMTAKAIDRVNKALGRFLGWGVLALVLVQVLIILLNNVFRIGSIELQESLLYINSMIFLGAAGYTLAVDDHVRVDIFYSTARPRTKAIINLLGTLFLLFPVLWLLWRFGLPYVLASWAVFEGSTETTGLQGIYLLKSLLLVYVVLLGAQGLSLVIRSALFLMPKPRSGEQ